MDLTTEQCELTSVSPQVTANLSVAISGGPPSSISCNYELTNQPANFTKFLQIVQASVPVQIVLFIVFSPLNNTGNIICTIENSAGPGDSVSCSLNSMCYSFYG